MTGCARSKKHDGALEASNAGVIARRCAAPLVILNLIQDLYFKRKQKE
jgi:tRNA(Leu) C34 or U34 (ribose-2'-O)-methylase TrmL